MNRTIPDNEIRPTSNVYSRQQGPDNSTTVLRTLVERGVRPVDNASSQPTSTSTISTLAKQHEDERRELQELNLKFSNYLDRVQYLEDFHEQLLTQLKDLKARWGIDAGQVKNVYGPDLQALRKGINDAIKDQAFHELQLKRYEFDIWEIEQQIAAFGIDDEINYVKHLEQQLNSSSADIERLKMEYDQRLLDLNRIRDLMEHLLAELYNLKNEFDSNQLERVMLENELQTLREHTAFQNAIYQAQRQEILTLNTPVLDVSSFYRTELARAIADIRHDFEVLSQSQVNELEEYYRVKTEQIREEIASENERKRLLASEGVLESMDIPALNSFLKESRDDLNILQSDQGQLQGLVDGLIDDLEKIQDEHIRERQLNDQELNRLRENVSNTQQKIDDIMSGNVSLRFEMSTYRRLLDVEEKHMNRIAEEEQQPVVQTSSPPYQTQSAGRGIENLITKKMTVHKTARGPIAFDTVDLETDTVVILNESYTGKEQLFRDWSIRRQNDQQPEIIYQFPSTFVLRPRQKVRILTRKSRESAQSSGEVLLANRIETWGQGQRMITRLFDENNEEKAVINQVFQ